MNKIIHIAVFAAALLVVHGTSWADEAGALPPSQSQPTATRSGVKPGLRESVKSEIKPQLGDERSEDDKQDDVDDEILEEVKKDLERMGMPKGVFII